VRGTSVSSGDARTDGRKVDRVYRVERARPAPRQLAHGSVPLLIFLNLQKQNIFPPWNLSGRVFITNTRSHGDWSGLLRNEANGFNSLSTVST